MTNKQTSSRISSLAAKVLSGYEPTEGEIRSLAASALSQDEVKGDEPQPEVAAEPVADDHRMLNEPLTDEELRYLLDTTQHRPQYQRAFRQLIALRSTAPPVVEEAVKAEREACLKLAQDIAEEADGGEYFIATRIAKAILARSATP
jgi:hypothetical protein